MQQRYRLFFKITNYFKKTFCLSFSSISVFVLLFRLSEEVGAVEVGLGNVDGEEGDEVGRGEVVAAFIDVEAEAAGRNLMGVLAEKGVGQGEGELPRGGRTREAQGATA